MKNNVPACKKMRRLTMSVKQKQQQRPSKGKKTPKPRRNHNDHKPQPKEQSKQGKLNLPQPTPVLRFCPTAWAKLLFFRDRGQTEIGGFGLASADDLLRVEDFVTVKQQDTVASVSFDDEAVADLFETQVDAGCRPEQFARIWLHTHPGGSPEPSATDEETFRARRFLNTALT